VNDLDLHLFSNPAGWPAFLMMLACAIYAEGAPSLRFLQGRVAMLRVHLILFGHVIKTHMAPAFPTPAPSEKTRRNGAPTVL
jgi:hypothetical protein